MYPCAPKRRMEKNRIRKRKREREEEEMGKGTFRGVSYVLSACVHYWLSFATP